MADRNFDDVRHLYAQWEARERSIAGGTRAESRASGEGEAPTIPFSARDGVLVRDFRELLYAIEGIIAEFTGMIRNVPAEELGRTLAKAGKEYGVTQLLADENGGEPGDVVLSGYGGPTMMTFVNYLLEVRAHYQRAVEEREAASDRPDA